MVLNRKISSSSIAEVVIALAVIAICFTVASLVFIRSMNATMKFVDFKQQTKIQSELLHQMIEETKELAFDDEVVELNESEMDSVVELHFTGTDDKIIWKQEWLKAD